MSSQRITGLLFLLGVFILGLSVYQLLSLPETFKEIREAKARVIVLKEKNEKLSETLLNIKAVESDLQLLKAAIPTLDDVPLLMTQLEEIGKESGVTVQHLGFGEGKALEKTEGGAQTVSLTIVATGPLPALQTFLKNLEGAARIINVSSFRFSPAYEKTGKEGETGLSSTLGVTAYYLLPPKELKPERPLSLDQTSPEYLSLIKRAKSLRIYKPL